jgi:hypothetical protein
VISRTIARKTSHLGFTALLCCLSSSAATAQAPIQPVSWSITTNSGAAAKPGSHLTLDVTAHIDSGWHVYGFHQDENGPTPLRITVDPRGFLELTGKPEGTSPTRKHDASFGLDTEIFEHAITLHVPVLVKPGATAESRELSLNVRFQACNDHICLPPKTVHLVTSIKGPAGQGSTAP